MCACDSVSPVRAWNVTGSGRKAPEETLTTQGGVGTAGVDPLVEVTDPSSLLKAEKRKGFLWGFRHSCELAMSKQKLN